MTQIKVYQRMPVKGPSGAVIGEATAWSIDQDGNVDCEIRLDPPVPDWLRADVNHLSIDPTKPSDPIFPVVITQTTERVVWVRAVAEDEATDIVAEHMREHFESDRSSPQNGPYYSVRAIPPEMVLPST